MDLTCYNSYYEVNLSVLEENFKKISRFIAPAQVIPVLKADAYGMGALEIARVLTERCGCRTLACSQTYEGLVLREGGITDAEILIMGPVLHDTLPHAVRWDMQIPLFTPERVRSLSREAARQGKTVKAQIKIETGLNRIGAWPGKQLQEVIDALHQCPNIQVVGAFTHFAQAKTPSQKNSLLCSKRASPSLKKPDFICPISTAAIRELPSGTGKRWTFPPTSGLAAWC